jgi:hypothetical protein
VKTLARSIFFLLFFVCLQPCAEANCPGDCGSGFSGPFVKNRLSAQLVTEALFGPVSWVHDHAAFNYAQTSLRFGWMATDSKERRYFGRGNFELMFELTNSVVFKGSGNYLRGFTLHGRYNLLLSHCFPLNNSIRLRSPSGEVLQIWGASPDLPSIGGCARSRPCIPKVNLPIVIAGDVVTRNWLTRRSDSDKGKAIQ